MAARLMRRRQSRARLWVLACALAAVCLAPSPSSGAQEDDRTQIIQMKDATIDVRFDFTPSERLRKLVMGRIALSAKAVAAYYRQYPVPAVEIWVGSHRGRGINSGHAFGSPRAHLSISVGVDSTEPDFAEDWETTHEMVHLAFPSVAPQHHWIEEGLATYVEPIARARIGELSPQKVWGDMVDGMPNGLPRPGDRGLDFTHTWGRTYWGGALFCLLADIEIRKRTENRRGLEDALRGILRAGGNIESEWPLSRALATADRAAGVTVLEDLYATMRAAPAAPDLNKLWRDLGVERRTGTVAFDDSAPLAAIRKAITQPANPEP
jgi:hypothetical protein